MTVTDIGRCSSCFKQPCAKPKAKQLYPDLGCLDWQDKQPFNWDDVKTETVEPIKE